MTELIGEWLDRNSLGQYAVDYVAPKPPHVVEHMHDQLDELCARRLELEAELFVTNMRIDNLKANL